MLFTAKRSKAIFILLVIFIVGLLIRVYFWKNPSTLSWDEGAHSLAGIFVIQFSLHKFSLPYAYDYLYKYWATMGSLFFYPWGYSFLTVISYLIFGVSEFSARLPNMFFSILIIFPTYLLANEIYGKKVGILSSFFAAVNPWFIIWGGRALADLPMLSLMSFASYFLIKAAKTRSEKDWALMGISLGIAGQMKPIAFLILPLILLYVFLKDKKLMQSRGFIAGISISIIILGSYFAFGLFSKYLVYKGEYIYENVFHWVGLSLVDTGNRVPLPWTSISGWTYYLYLLPAQFGIITLFLAFVGLAGKIRKHNTEELYLILTVLLVYLAFVLLPNKDPRYTMPFITTMCIFSSLGAIKISSLTSNSFYKGIILALTAALVLVASLYAILSSSAINYPDAGLNEVADRLVKEASGMVAVINETDELNVQSVSFYLAARDPELKFGVHWSNWLNSSKYVVSREILNYIALFNITKQNGTIYLYERR